MQVRAFFRWSVGWSVDQLGRGLLVFPAVHFAIRAPSSLIADFHPSLFLSSRNLSSHESLLRGSRKNHAVGSRIPPESHNHTADVGDRDTHTHECMKTDMSLIYTNLI